MQPTNSSGDLSEAATLLRFMAGYQLSQAIYVAAVLGVADHLGDEPATADALAHQIAVHPPSLLRLLRTLSAFGILAEDAGEQFTLTPIGAFLQADHPTSLRPTILQQGSDHFWGTWRDLLHSIQTGESAMAHLFDAPNPFTYYASHPEVGAMMNAGFMAQGQLKAQAVVAAYDFTTSGVIVDVGGGRGQLLAAILGAHPSLHGVLFDLPHVVAQADTLFAQANALDRCTLIGGDIFVEIPAGGDTYILANIIHDWPDAQSLAILRNCRRVVGPGVKLLLVERVLPSLTDVSPASQAAMLSDLTMLVRTGGRERTEDEHRALLAAAGFALRVTMATQLGYTILVADPAATP